MALESEEDCRRGGRKVAFQAVGAGYYQVFDCHFDRHHHLHYLCRRIRYVAVCCSVLQCVAVCCSVLQRVAVCCGDFDRHPLLHYLRRGIRYVAVCCRVLQCVAAILIGTLSCTIYAVGLGMLHCVAVCCRVLQCIAVCCSVLRPFWSAPRLALCTPRD